MDRQSHYYRQVQLLLQIIPFVAQHDCFALKGGTAINLFVRDFPRLSVDIDLVFLPMMDQGASTLCSLINQRTIEHDNRHSNLLSSVYFVGLAHRIHSA